MKKIYISIILFSFAILIVLGIVVLVNRPDTSPKLEKANITLNNEVQEEVYENFMPTNSSQEKISPNCKITFIKNYTLCEHLSKETQDVSYELVNLTFEEFSTLYSDWNIEDFNSTSITLCKNIPSYCGEHFVVKDTSGYITIYSVNPSGELSLSNQTDILTKYLPNSDITELSEGVKIYGRNNLNSYLENFE